MNNFRPGVRPSVTPILAIPLWLAISSAQAAGPPVRWETEQLFSPPGYEYAHEFDEEGVRALFYDGLEWQGRPTRVFAWYGAPQGASPANPAPAMVLVHGGGGTAFAEWVRLWTGRGYAAIAMDTCGAVPRGTYGNWERHAAGGPPGWGGFHQTDGPVEDHWTYHAVADVLLAHSLVRSFPEVDADRTGITGISWGGYLTCIAAGLDNRFRFAAPVYGCGYYDLSEAFSKSLDQLPAENRARWLNLWDPKHYLPGARMPFLWVTGTNDFAYPLDALKRSAALPAGPQRFCVRLRMPHAHGGPGENPEEIRAVAGHYLRGGPAPASVSLPQWNGKELTVRCESETPIASAELLYTLDDGPWTQREWRAAPARLDAENGAASAAPPDGTTACFINLVNSQGHAAGCPPIIRGAGN